MGTKLFVGNISFKATEDDINSLFADAGTVVSVHVVTDTHTGQSKGFGFVEMSSEEEAKNAIELLNGKVLLDRPVTVDEARPPKQQKPRGGFGGDRGGGGGYGRNNRSGGQRRR